MGNQPDASYRAPSADALPATLYGHFTKEIYRNRPIEVKGGSAWTLHRPTRSGSPALRPNRGNGCHGVSRGLRPRAESGGRGGGDSSGRGVHAFGHGRGGGGGGSGGGGGGCGGSGNSGGGLRRGLQPRRRDISGEALEPNSDKPECTNFD
jgi:hypothetical protein